MQSNVLYFKVQKSFKLLFFFGVLSWCAFLSLSSHAKGNTEFSIRSPYDGSSPYQVVVENQYFFSKKSPGIYSSDLANGQDWNLLIPGQVLLNNDGSPFFKQLELTKYDQRHESFAVVDGSLYLFQNKTADKEMQLIKMGEGNGTVGLFPVGVELKLPLIQAVDDLVIEVCPIVSFENSRGQPVGVSIRCRQDCNPHYNGGISFLLMLPQGVPSNSATPLLEMIPLATEGDLKFMTQRELRNRICHPAP